MTAPADPADPRGAGAEATGGRCDACREPAYDLYYANDGRRVCVGCILREQRSAARPPKPDPRAARIAALLAALAAARAFLGDRPAHRGSCAVVWHRGPCDCGRDAALAQLDAALAAGTGD